MLLQYQILSVNQLPDPQIIIGITITKNITKAAAGHLIGVHLQSVSTAVLTSL